MTSATGLHNHQFGTSTEREVKGQLFHVLMAIRIRLPLSAVIDVLRARGGAGQEQRAFASVSGERCGALELLVCLIEPAKLGQEITAHTVASGIAAAGSAVSSSKSSSPAAGPNAIDSATARFSSTTGDGASWASVS